MRLKIIRWIYVVVIVLVVLRLAFWQIVSADDLSARAEDQRTLTQEIIAPRGDILFADGSLLAGSQPMYLLYAQPKVIEQNFAAADGSINQAAEANYKQSFAQQVAQVLVKNVSPLEASTSADLDNWQKQEQQTILDQLNQNLYWVNLGQTVDLTTKANLAKLNLAGLGFQSDTGRFYPEGSSSAHLLGFVSKDAYGNQKGYFGVE